MNEAEGSRQESNGIKESETPILDRLKLVNGASAKDFVTEHVQTFPTTTIVIFGEPARGKTTIASDLSRHLSSLGIEAPLTTYDSASGRIIHLLGRDKPEWAIGDYDLLSDHLLETFLQRQAQPTAGRRIGILELVGVGMKNRGSSTLFSLIDIAKAEEKGNSSFLFLAVASDLAIQEEAGYERRRVATLPPDEVLMFLRGRNLEIVGLNEHLDPEEIARIVKSYYATMARPDQIETIRQEVARQSASYVASDLQRLFTLFSPPETPHGARSIRRSENYKRQAAFLELYLEEQGLLSKSPLQSLDPSHFDSGIVVYNRYDPTIKRRFDLSLFQERDLSESTQISGNAY